VHWLYLAEVLYAFMLIGSSQPAPDLIALIGLILGLIDKRGESS
jgi:xanthosine utilization system XapX-like protein